MTTLERMRDLVQHDVGQRGLRTDPQDNLITATTGDFAAACASLAHAAAPSLAIVTGFFIPTATPPAGETDGPLGAVFLARAFVPLGIRVLIASDAFCIPALRAGLTACGLHARGLHARVPLLTLPSPTQSMGPEAYRAWFAAATAAHGVTHLLAIERVGPSQRDRCHTMRGLDVTDTVSPVHVLFEGPRAYVTLGIGDGGNEIGMGKVAADVIGRNIPRGELIACRVPVDHLIVAGVSNWGAYGLAAGVSALRGAVPAADLFDPATEQRILTTMVDAGPLVDGVRGRPTVSVDGLTWERYAEILPQLRGLI